MNDFTRSILLFTVLIATVACASWPLGRYMAWSMDPKVCGPRRQRLESFMERLAGRAGRAGQSWKGYALAMLCCNSILFAIGWLVLAFQAELPWNPDHKGALEPSLIFHTIASFVTNTNAQHYSGEVSLSPGAQLGALMWLQFLSAGTGIAALAAVARGLAGRLDMGNFFMDLQRATFLVLLPGALVLAALFVLGGLPMTMSGSANAITLEGVSQGIARGPVAAFVAIKQLGTNGGGYFGANSTHPFENPNFWTNVISMLAILIIPMSSVWMFGRIVQRMNHAKAIYLVMLLLLLGKIGCALWFESQPARAFEGLAGVEQVSRNLEGKELGFGTSGLSGPLWAALTTATSNGSVGAMHDSLNPLTGLVAMVGMWLNATYGGVGVGMINMLLYIVIAVFIAGMMVGRTPEYLNRRIEAREIKLAILATIAHGSITLLGTAIFSATAWGREATSNWGPHGFSQILYEFTSASANNGSGFEGLADNTVPWNIATGVAMLLNRYVPIVVPLAIASSLAAKRPTGQTGGTLSVQDSTFVVILVATILIVGALTFFPAAALGPLAEHFM